MEPITPWVGELLDQALFTRQMAEVLRLLNMKWNCGAPLPQRRGLHTGNASRCLRGLPGRAW
jgi:hypothetical protein